MSDRRRLPHVALSAYAHDRHGLERTDAEWLDARWHAPATRVLPIAGNRLLTSDGRPLWLDPAAVEATSGDTTRRILLGEIDDATHFAVLLDPDSEPFGGAEWTDLRSVLAALLDRPESPLVLHAIGMAEWHASTRFCPRCGHGLTASHAGHVLDCREPGGCGRQQFPRTDPAVIMLITDGEPGADDERCLLGRNRAWPPGRYSTLAGFVEPGETFEDAVRREVAEETGVQVGDVAYFGNQPWPLPASMMIGFTGRAVTTEIDVDQAELDDAGWFTRADIAAGLAAGTLLLPGGVSISHSLLTSWYGAPLDTNW